MDIPIALLVIVLFGITLWIVKAVERLGGGRTQ